MPAMTILSTNIFDTYRKSFFLGSLNITTTTVKMALLTGVYVPNQSTDEFWSEIVANEVSGSGYTQGGQIINNVVVTIDGAGMLKIDGDNPQVWIKNAAGFTNARVAVLYVDTGDDATSQLLFYSDDFGSDIGITVDAYAISFDTNGIFTLPR
jgi:hypothetical protein